MPKMPKRKYARSFPRPGRLYQIIFLSIILFLFILAFPVAMYLMITASDPKYQQWFGIATLGALAMAVLFRVMIYLSAGRTRCPLCQGMPFRAPRCHLHENARKLPFLTRSATMVADMIIYGRFVCKYCGTPFRLKK